MFTFIVVLIIITCVLLGLIVLIQNSKGGGLAAGFGSSNQIMGVRKTTDVLEKVTWGLAITLIVFSLVANLSIPRGTTTKQGSSMQEQIDNAQAPMEQAPAQPQQQPQQQPAK